jgi:hypothetical protein
MEGLQMKKFISGILVGLLISVSATAFGAGGIRLVIDGVDITDTMDVKPQIIDGRTMVPAAYVAENLGATVGWVEETQTVTITSKQVASSNVAEAVPERVPEIVTERVPETDAQKPDPTPINAGTLTLGDTFVFDDLEITFGKNIKWVTLENQFSDLDGSTVIQIPMTVKNLKNETHGLNMFYYTLYGSKGTELDDVSSYFDESVDFAGKLRTGASQNVYMFMLYDGNGDYYVSFETWGSDPIEVRIPISK